MIKKTRVKKTAIKAKKEMEKVVPLTEDTAPKDTPSEVKK